jgi:predicted dienelactone hydrolase
VRVADTKYVLRTLERLAAGQNPDAEQRTLPRGLGRALDLRKVGMFGYSLGGFAAGETMVTDRRIDAGANLDGTMQFGFPEGVLSEVAKRGLDRPFLLFGAMGHSHAAGNST